MNDDIKYCQMCGGSKKDFGTKGNKVTIKMPEEWETERDSRYFDIDSCMVPEISALWREGVRTIECCCGHGITRGYIAVADESINKMYELGYHNTAEKPYRSDLFYPAFHNLVFKRLETAAIINLRGEASERIRELEKEQGDLWDEIKALKQELDE